MEPAHRSAQVLWAEIRRKLEHVKSHPELWDKIFTKDLVDPPIVMPDVSLPPPPSGLQSFLRRLFESNKDANPPAAGVTTLVAFGILYIFMSKFLDHYVVNITPRQRTETEVPMEVDQQIPRPNPVEGEKAEIHHVPATKGSVLSTGVRGDVARCEETSNHGGFESERGQDSKTSVEACPSENVNEPMEERTTRTFNNEFIASSTKCEDWIKNRINEATDDCAIFSDSDEEDDDESEDDDIVDFQEGNKGIPFMRTTIDDGVRPVDYVRFHKLAVEIYDRDYCHNILYQASKRGLRWPEFPQYELYFITTTDELDSIKLVLAFLFDEVSRVSQFVPYDLIDKPWWNVERDVNEILEAFKIDFDEDLCGILNDVLDSAANQLRKEYEECEGMPELIPMAAESDCESSRAKEVLDEATRISDAESEREREELEKLYAGSVEKAEAIQLEAGRTNNQNFPFQTEEALENASPSQGTKQSVEAALLKSEEPDDPAVTELWIQGQKLFKKLMVEKITEMSPEDFQILQDIICNTRVPGTMGVIASYLHGRVAKVLAHNITLSTSKSLGTDGATPLKKSETPINSGSVPVVKDAQLAKLQKPFDDIFDELYDRGTEFTKRLLHDFNCNFTDAAIISRALWLESIKDRYLELVKDVLSQLEKKKTKEGEAFCERVQKLGKGIRLMEKELEYVEKMTAQKKLGMGNHAESPFAVSSVNTSPSSVPPSTSSPATSVSSNSTPDATGNIATPKTSCSHHLHHSPCDNVGGAASEAPPSIGCSPPSTEVLTMANEDLSKTAPKAAATVIVDYKPPTIENVPKVEVQAAEFTMAGALPVLPKASEAKSTAGTDAAPPSLSESQYEEVELLSDLDSDYYTSSDEEYGVESYAEFPEDEENYDWSDGEGSADQTSSEPSEVLECDNGSDSEEYYSSDDDSECVPSMLAA